MASKVIASTMSHAGRPSPLGEHKAEGEQIEDRGEDGRPRDVLPRERVDDVRLSQVDRKMQPLIEDEQGARHRVDDDDRREELLRLGARRPAERCP